LLEDVLVSLQFQDRFASSYLGEKGFGANPSSASLATGASFAPDMRASIIAVPTPK
jgi:hypothetical protein